MWWRRCAVRSTPRPSACPAAPSACSGSRSTARRRRSRVDMTLPQLMRPNTTLRMPVKIDGLARRGGAHRGRRGRCRHSQSHQLQAAGAGRLLSRPAPAHRRNPRSLRPADRRHAGHARRRSAPAATAPAAELQGSPPTQPPLALYSGIVTVGRDGTAEVVVRHPGLRRHRARDGGGLVEGQGRPRQSATSPSAIRWC